MSSLNRFLAGTIGIWGWGPKLKSYFKLKKFIVSSKLWYVISYSPASWTPPGSVRRILRASGWAHCPRRWRNAGLFSIDLRSGLVEMVCDARTRVINLFYTVVPYMSFYIPGMVFLDLWFARPYRSCKLSVSDMKAWTVHHDTMGVQSVYESGADVTRSLRLPIPFILVMVTDHPWQYDGVNAERNFGSAWSPISFH